MDSKELFYKYTDFYTLKGIGENWVTQIKGYVPLGGWIATAGAYQIALWALNIRWVTYWEIILFLSIKFYIMILINWLGGKIAIKIGLYKAQQQYSAKNEYLNPYNVELIETLKAICKKLGIEDKFTKL